MATRPSAPRTTRRTKARETIALRVDEPVRAYLRSEAASRSCTPSEVARTILARHIAGEERTVATLRQELLHGLDTLGKQLASAVTATSSWEQRQSRLGDMIHANQAQVKFLCEHMETARHTLEGAQREVVRAGESVERANRRLPWQVWVTASLLGVLPVVLGALYLGSHGYAMLGDVERTLLHTGVRFQVSYSGLPPEQRAQVRTLLGWEE